MLEFTSKEPCHDLRSYVKTVKTGGNQRKLKKCFFLYKFALLLYLNYNFMSLAFDNQDGNSSNYL